ncbi:hypothetical protein Lser_V15G04095 [Lactuca serriola]
MIIGHAIPSNFIPHIDKCFMEAANSWCFSCCGYDIAKFSEGGWVHVNAHNLAQENGVNDFLPLGNLEKVVKEIDDQPLPLVDGIEDQLVEFSLAMRIGPTFAKNLGNFEQKVGGSGSLKHYPIELKNGEKSQRCCGENGICSHVVLMCIVTSKVARDVVKVGNKFF